MGPILREAEADDRIENNIADSNETYKTTELSWTRNWGSTDRRSQITQIILPRSRMKDVLTEVHGG
jgi:hypothetical protein